jgi:hypothetical protein
MFMTAIASRNSAETSVPITPPTLRKLSSWSRNAVAVAAIATEASITTVEWPREKKKPTPTGRLPSCISLRVTLSMAAMWSASTAWRRPKP